jgi:hypothetical protein
MVCPECGSTVPRRDVEGVRSYPSYAAILLWFCGLPLIPVVVCWAILGAVLCGADRRWMEFGAKWAGAFLFGAPFCVILGAWCLALWWTVTPRAHRGFVVRRAFVALCVYLVMLLAVGAWWFVAAMFTGGWTAT